MPHKRYALVTGGSRGIGAAIVRAFAMAGRDVALTHVGDGEAAHAVVDDLLQGGVRAVAFDSDASDEVAVEELHTRLSEMFQASPAILVNCAGVVRDRVVWKSNPEDFDRVLSVNLRGAYLQTRAVAQGMRDAGWGRIVNISSINGLRGKFGQTAYAASKAGLIGLTKTHARELGSAGVTVNAVAPGWVDTEMTGSLEKEFRQRALAETCTGSVCQPEDIANAVAFLCSDAARQITGQVLTVDGGQYL